MPGDYQGLTYMTVAVMLRIFAKRHRTLYDGQ